jgi:translation initiation factor IF-3
VIDHHGGQLGVMTPQEGIKLARERESDLVEIVPKAKPPVCKIISYGKFKYEQAKKDKFQRKHQHVSVLKELRFHPNTDTHDFDFKARHAEQFLLEGHKVKATVMFRGRQITRVEQGQVLLDRLAERTADVARIDQPPRMEGRSMVMLLVPERKKKKEKKETDTKPGSGETPQPKKEKTVQG